MPLAPTLGKDCGPPPTRARTMAAVRYSAHPSHPSSTCHPIPAPNHPPTHFRQRDGPNAGDGLGHHQALQGWPYLHTLIHTGHVHTRSPL